MSRLRLDALSTPTDTGGCLLSCPGPGKVRVQRRAGEQLVPDSRLGLLIRDDQVFELTIPTGTHGVVKEILLEDPWVACEHGQQLVRLGPAGEEVLEQQQAAAQAASSGLFEIRSPTHGTFYHRPSPEADPFVALGQKVRRGDTLGLVEVMKCFSPILFDPPSGVESGTVRELPVSNGRETLMDQVLIRVDLDR